MNYQNNEMMEPFAPNMFLGWSWRYLGLLGFCSSDFQSGQGLWVFPVAVLQRRKQLQLQDVFSCPYYSCCMVDSISRAVAMYGGAWPEAELRCPSRQSSSDVWTFEGPCESGWSHGGAQELSRDVNHTPELFPRDKHLYLVRKLVGRKGRDFENPQIP